MAGLKSNLINRELSWLEFNQRVLAMAQDPDVPALERLKFLAITASNLDEFFMVRVGGLHALLQDGVRQPDPAGLTPADQLLRIHERVRRMVREQYVCFRSGLEPALARAGIRRLSAGELSLEQHEFIRQHFVQSVFPVITPMAVQGEAAFPLLANLSLCLAVRLRPGPRGPKPLFAVIPVSAGLERFVAVPGESGYAFMLVEDIVARFVDRLFPGETVAESAVFRITRNADLSAREDDAADFLAEMESVLSRRRVSGCVRLEVEEATSRILTVFLRRALAVAESGVCRVRGPLDLSAFHRLAAMQGFTRLKYEPWPPQPLPQLDPKKSLFDELARQSVVLSHPYDSFDPVVRLVEEAAADPNVLAIKQILYRTSANSPIVAALRRAAERGKYVTAIVELKARFDEARNIEWARRLEEAGAQVIYGVKGLKTHAKLCIVVRREPRGIARYLHFGTGNYNEKTARLYSDIGYLTSDEDLGADASAFFNAVSGYSVPQSFVKLAAAPMGLRRKLTELIEAEVQRRREGQPALIMAKMNSLADPSIINSLYRASQAGVEVLLNVRGICCLRPGVKGLSESITVVSVVDRFLEHSRVFYFHQGGQAKVFLSSADWMPRNLDRRIELMAPVEDAACRKKLIALLRTCLADSVNAWRLRPDGTYERLRPARGRRAVRSQEVLYREGRAAARAARQAKRTVFEPHRPPEREP